MDGGRERGGGDGLKEGEKREGESVWKGSEEGQEQGERVEEGHGGAEQECCSGLSELQDKKDSPRLEQWKTRSEGESW